MTARWQIRQLVETFDQHKGAFVSVTQQFNTTASVGRLTLNVPLSFAQFEREVTSERTLPSTRNRGSRHRASSSCRNYELR
jgi:DNA invertase Pin-like site-specific DNA recombinase